MAAKPKSPTAKSATKDKGSVKKVNFLQELMWVFERYGFSQVKEFISDLERDVSSNIQQEFGLQEFAPKNPNQLFLVGVLPKIFSDAKIFSSNEEIANFSEDILKVKISRWEKKSRLELIGHIVCSTAQADDKKLEQIATALKKLHSGRKDADIFLEKSRQDKKSWNEIIQLLLQSDQ
uniref:Uncharacterized protein n=1 Tax=Desulfovibrio desulfuricans (strain ATCC 27774 / DSM 6949 / MB) TaxID=525146 RepID=B8J3W3_DESDA